MSEREVEDVPGVLDAWSHPASGVDGFGSLQELSSGFRRLPPRLVPGLRSKPLYRVQAGRSEVTS